MDEITAGSVVAVHRHADHEFSKATVERVELVTGIGVAGDAHAGATVQHRSRVRADPTQPNLRQVHLITTELLDELRERGFHVAPGDLGENVTTRGVDLLGLPTGTTLRLGRTALVVLTGLRNPCVQIDRFERGLQGAVLGRTDDGELMRRAGVMAVVVQGGKLGTGDPIEVGLPPGTAVPLRPI